MKEWWREGVDCLIGRLCDCLIVSGCVFRVVVSAAAGVGVMLGAKGTHENSLEPSALVAPFRSIHVRGESPHPSTIFLR